MSNLYFNHFYGLRNQTEILEIRAEFGIEGYGLYLMLLETMAESETNSINKNLVRGLSLNLNCDLEKLKNLINFCTKLNLFYLENDFIFSKHLKEHFEKRTEIKEKRAEAGAKGGKAKANAKQKLANAKQNVAKKESKENKINKKENKENIKEILDFFNFTFNKNLKNSISWEDNASYWLDFYSLEDIKKAIKNLGHPNWWAKDRIDLNFLFRKANSKGKCDYIQELLELKDPEVEKVFDQNGHDITYLTNVF